MSSINAYLDCKEHILSITIKAVNSHKEYIDSKNDVLSMTTKRHEIMDKKSKKLALKEKTST